MYRKGARVALACALAALAAALAAGCGGLASGEDDGGAGAGAAGAERTADGAQRSGGGPSSAGDAAAQGAPRPAAERGGAGGCRAGTARLLAAMEELRRSLIAGLDYRAYLKQMRGLRAAYEALPIERLPLACLEGVAAPAERALNRYIAALNLWGDCIEEPGCQAAAVEVPLQRRWRQAARHLSRARRGLG